MEASELAGLRAKLAALQHDTTISVYQQDPDHADRFRPAKILTVSEGPGGIRVNIAAALPARAVDPSRAELQGQLAAAQAEIRRINTLPATNQIASGHHD